MAAKYIKKLADKYDTVGIKRNFTSICGNKVSVSGGTYGWRIDQKAETKNLVKTIKKGKSVKINQNMLTEQRAVKSLISAVLM